MTDRYRKPLPLPKTPKFIEVKRLTHLEKFQAIDRSQRKAPVVRLYQYQKDAFDKFMKKVLDCKGGTW